MQSELLITDNSAVEQINNQPITLDERILNVTLENYAGVLSEISSLGSMVMKDGYLEKLSKALKVKKVLLEREIGSASDEGIVVRSASFPELVDLVENDKGDVGYLVKQNGLLSYTDSWNGPNGEKLLPPGRQHLKFTLGKSKRIQEIYNAEIDVEELFDDLILYFKRFSYLPDDVWPLIVFSVFLSYIQDHKDIRYIPVIYFYAVAERGKSRTAKSMLSVSYRGIHLADLASANVLRFSQNLNATLFFDCTDLWGSAAKSDCADILLNRFEKGATVSRVKHPEKGAFEDQVHYEVYGSTIVATNEPANTIFETRCLAITMPNRPGEYEDLIPEMGIELKERLTAWRAKMMGSPLPTVDVIPGISSRLWEIAKPLFRLCELIKPNVRGSMISVLMEMVGQKAEDKKNTIEGQIVAAINLLADFSRVNEAVIPVEDIRKRINTDRTERYQISSPKIGKRIKALGLNTKGLRGYAHLVVSEPELAILKDQYGLSLPEVSLIDVPDEIDLSFCDPENSEAWDFPDELLVGEYFEIPENPEPAWIIPDDVLELMKPQGIQVESGGSGRECLKDIPTVQLSLRPWSKDVD